MKYLTRNMKVQFIMAGKTRQLEREAAGHVVSTVRIQREMDAGTQLTFSFLSKARS